VCIERKDMETEREKEEKEYGMEGKGKMLIREWGLFFVLTHTRVFCICT